MKSVDDLIEKLRKSGIKVEIKDSREENDNETISKEDKQICNEFFEKLFEAYVQLKDRARKCSKPGAAELYVINKLATIITSTQLAFILENNGDIENEEEIDNIIAWAISLYYTRLRKCTRIAIEKVKNGDEEWLELHI
jgi:hypothetical protein